MPTAVGEFRLCASGVQEAFVTVMQATCAFDYIDTGLSPCSADPCVEDETSDKCQDYLAEYCAKHPEDSGCLFVAPRFARARGVPASVEVPVAGFSTGVKIVSTECSCGGGCETTDADLLAVSYDSSTVHLRLDFVLLSRKALKVCANIGVEETHIATVEPLLSSGDCLFMTDVGSPCTLELCDDLESEECQLYIADYCKEKSDPGCNLISLRFIRNVGETSTLALATKLIEISKLDLLRFVDAACSCTAPCGASAVEVVSARVEFGAAIVELLPSEVGEYALCSDRDVVLALTVQQQGCLFAEEGSPCFADVCNDDDSEACQIYTAEYCAKHPEDGGCDSFLPRFVRDAFTKTTLDFHASKDRKSVV